MTNIPCQTDAAVREWDRLEYAADAKSCRIDEIVANAIDNDADWQAVREVIVEQGRVDDLLDRLRADLSAGIAYDGRGRCAGMYLLTLIRETVCAEFDALDNRVSGSDAP